MFGVPNKKVEDDDKKFKEGQDKFQEHFKQVCAGHQTCIIKLDTEDLYNKPSADD